MFALLAFLLGFDTALVGAVFAFGFGFFAAGLLLAFFFAFTFFGNNSAGNEGQCKRGDQQRFDELHNF